MITLKLEALSNEGFVPSLNKLLNLDGLDALDSFGLASSIDVIQDRLKHYSTVKTMLIKKYGFLVPKTEFKEEHFAIYHPENTTENIAAFEKEMKELNAIEFNVPLERRVLLPKLANLRPVEIYPVLQFIELQRPVVPTDA